MVRRDLENLDRRPKEPAPVVRQKLRSVIAAPDRHAAHLRHRIAAVDDRILFDMIGQNGLVDIARLVMARDRVPDDAFGNEALDKFGKRKLTKDIDALEARLVAPDTVA